jgi:hypothetical protein
MHVCKDDNVQLIIYRNHLSCIYDKKQIAPAALHADNCL